MAWIFNQLIVPALPDFSSHYPGISIQAISGLQERNLARREAEFAIRFEMQPHRHELCLPVAELAYSIYAPANKVVDDLPWVGFMDDFHYSEPQAWQEKSCPEPFGFEANDAGIVYQAVRAGLGKGLLPDVLGARDPSLVRMSGKEPEFVRSLRVLVHKDMHHVARVSVVIDWLKEVALAA